jgi:hypothetical protein
MPRLGGSDEDEEASDEESEERKGFERSRCSSPANAQLGLKVDQRCYTRPITSTSGSMSGERFLAHEQGLIRVRVP